METADIERDVRTFLIDNFLFGRADKLRDDESLLDNVIESTGVLELVVFLQERFVITVTDQDVNPDNLDSVKNIAAYVARKLQSKP
jgi:acyl carrier protein